MNTNQWAANNLLFRGAFDPGEAPGALHGQGLREQAFLP